MDGRQENAYPNNPPGYNTGYANNPPSYNTGYANPITEQHGAYYPGPMHGQHNTTSTVVVQQPAPTNVIVASAPDNMGLAIFACLCCFWPLGLVAIFRANESQNALARGDINSARESGADARRFSLISIAIGVIGIIVSIIVISVMVTNNVKRYSSYNNNYN